MRQARYRKQLLTFVCVVVLLGSACGRAPTTTAGASATDSPSAPTTATPSPGVGSFALGDCTYPEAGGVQTEPLIDNFKMTVEMPTGWMRSPRPHDETTLLLLQAPTNYTYSPTTIRIQSQVGYHPNATPG